MSKSHILFSSLNPDDLIEDIANVTADKVYAKIRNEIQNLMPKPARKRLTRKQVATLKKESLVTVDRKSKAGIYKKYKEGGRFFFYEDEIMQSHVKIES